MRAASRADHECALRQPRRSLGALTRSRQDVKIKKGQDLAAKGVVVRVGDEPVLIANRIKQRDKTVEIDRMGQLQQLRQKYQKSGGGNQGATGGRGGTRERGNQGQ